MQANEVEEKFRQLKQEFIDKLKAIGGKSGNITLQRDLHWSDNQYQSTRDALLQDGLILLGKGKGGSVRLASVQEEPDPLSDREQEATEALSEEEQEFVQGIVSEFQKESQPLEAMPKEMGTKLRILHTADWHLGQILDGFPRQYEHQRFLHWLLDYIEKEKVDALLIAGDIFHVAKPKPFAIKMWHQFLADATRCFPELDIVAIAGNHDDASFLETSKPLLDGKKIHIVGQLARKKDQEFDLERVIVPLYGQDGAVAAWCGAVPYLEETDLAGVYKQGAFLERVKRLYADVVALAQAKDSKKPIVLMGHCLMQGGVMSEDSERVIWATGGQCLTVESLQPDAVAYVALGHLHKAQQIPQNNETVRYSGSPLPFSIAEADYTHQVCLVDMDEHGQTKVRNCPIPRPVRMVRLTKGELWPLKVVLEILERLPGKADVEADSEATWPYVEIQVQLADDEPRDYAKEKIIEKLKDKAVRCFDPKIVKKEGSDPPVSPVTPPPGKDPKAIREMFRWVFQKGKVNQEPSKELWQAFEQVMALAMKEV